MIFKVGGQRDAQGAVDGSGDGMPPSSKRGRTRGKRKRGVTCGPGTELRKCETEREPPKIGQERLTEILVWTTGESSRRTDSSTSSTVGGSGCVRPSTGASTWTFSSCSCGVAVRV